MTWVRAVLGFSLALVGGAPPDHRDPHANPHAAGRARPAATATPSDGGTPYDCSWLPRTAGRAGGGSLPAPLASLLEASVLGPPPLSQIPGTSLTDWERAAEAVRGARLLNREEMPRRERVLAQNAASRIALRARDDYDYYRQLFRAEDEARRRHDVLWAYFGAEERHRLQSLLPELSRAAARLAMRLALPATELESWGGQPDPGVEDWVGPRSNWVDRRAKQPASSPLRHEMISQGLKAFHPFRVGQERVLLSQLMAIDREGNPHITPVIGEIELRRDFGPQAPACILVLDRSGGDGAPPAQLRAIASSDPFPRGGFAQRYGDGRVNCHSCHDTAMPYLLGDLEDLSAAERRTYLDARRAQTLDQAQGAAAEILKLSRMPQ